MTNQISMHFEQSTGFDKPFITGCLEQCLAVLKMQINRRSNGLPIDDSICSKARESFFNFMRRATCENGFTGSERYRFMFRFFDLRDELEGLQNNDEVKQVSEPAPSTHVQLFRLLGKETKFQSFYALNEQAPSPASIPEHCFWPLFSIGWRPSLTLTKSLLSNARSVGGLA